MNKKQKAALIKAYLDEMRENIYVAGLIATGLDRYIVVRPKQKLSDEDRAIAIELIEQKDGE